MKRHPKVCKYFLVQKSCKFGEHCSYKHVDNNNQNDLSELTRKVNQLESLIKTMSQQIEKLTFELEVVQTDKEINTNDIVGQNKVKCDMCEYTASTSTVLKRHVTMKHKNNIQSVEIPVQLKCDLCDTSCTSQHELKGHTEFEHTPNLPHTSEWEDNKCHICNEIFKETVDFKIHIVNEQSFKEDIIVCYQCDESTDVGIYRPVPLQSIYMECKNCMKLP